jgi:hypothetical protein
MPELIHMADADGEGVAGMGVGATIQLDSRETCVVSLARISVRVSQGRFMIFGRSLYRERDMEKAARTAITLAIMYPNYALPRATRNLGLRAFANAIWHCADTDEVESVLNGAIEKYSEEQLATLVASNMPPLTHP